MEEKMKICPQCGKPLRLVIGKRVDSVVIDATQNTGNGIIHQTRFVTFVEKNFLKTNRKT